MINITEHIESRPYFQALRTVATVTARAAREAVAAGGGRVRDALHARAPADIYFVSVGQGSGIRLAKAVAKELGGETVHVYENFGTASVRVREGQFDTSMQLEFVGARKESYRRDSRKPNVEEGTSEEDQRRRDFSINAMAIHLAPDRFGDVVDPFNGIADLEAGLLRTPLEPQTTFEDDPLRMIRGARFAAQLDFRISKDAFQAMTRQRDRVKILSQERITEELQKIVCAKTPATGFRNLFE